MVSKAPRHYIPPTSCHKVRLYSSLTGSYFPIDYSKPIALSVIFLDSGNIINQFMRFTNYMTMYLATLRES